MAATSVARGESLKSSLAVVARTIDALNQKVGEFVSWLVVLMVGVQFAVVLMRYIYGIGSIYAQESIVYMHAFVFMIASGFALLRNGHVRIDIFYAAATRRRKALIDLFGVIFLLLPVCALIAWVGWPYVVASWMVSEGSPDGAGLPAVFVLKTAILVFPILLALQGLSMALRAVLVILDDPSPMPETEVEPRVPP